MQSWERATQKPGKTRKGSLKLDATGEANGRAAGQGQTPGGGSIWTQTLAPDFRPVVLPVPPGRACRGLRRPYGSRAPGPGPETLRLCGWARARACPGLSAPPSPRPLGAPPPGAQTSRVLQPHSPRGDARGRAPGARVSADPSPSGAPPPGAFGRRRSEASGAARSPRRRAAGPAALGRRGPSGGGARAEQRSLSHTLPFPSPARSVSPGGACPGLTALLLGPEVRGAWRAAAPAARPRGRRPFGSEARRRGGRGRRVAGRGPRGGVLRASVAAQAASRGGREEPLGGRKRGLLGAAMGSRWPLPGCRARVRGASRDACGSLAGRRERENAVRVRFPPNASGAELWSLPGALAALLTLVLGEFG